MVSDENKPLTKPDILILSCQNDEQLTMFQKLALAVKEANQRKKNIYEAQNLQETTEENPVS